MIGRGQIRQRIAAKNGRFARFDEQPQNHKLPRLVDREGLPIDWRQTQGSYVIAFLMNIRDSHPSKSGPCGRLFLIRESRISFDRFRARLLLENRLKRRLPTLAECGNPQRPLQLFLRMSRQIQEGVNLGHAHSLWTVSNFQNVVARPNFSFLQHAKIESRPVMRYEQGRHPRIIHANADAVTCYPRLCHFKYRITNAVTITNAGLVIRKSLNSEIFSKLAEDEVFTSEKTFPVLIAIHLINKNSALLTTVTGQITLSVAGNIELAHHLSSLNWTFPDRGTDSLAVPSHVARKTDIY